MGEEPFEVKGAEPPLPDRDVRRSVGRPMTGSGRKPPPQGSRPTATQRRPRRASGIHLSEMNDSHRPLGGRDGRPKCRS